MLLFFERMETQGLVIWEDYSLALLWCCSLAGTYAGSRNEISYLWLAWWCLNTTNCLGVGHPRISWLAWWSPLRTLTTSSNVRNTEKDIGFSIGKGILLLSVWLLCQVYRKQISRKKRHHVLFWVRCAFLCINYLDDVACLAIGNECTYCNCTTLVESNCLLFTPHCSPCIFGIMVKSGRWRGIWSRSFRT
jgi:hypothetical protein